MSSRFNVTGPLKDAAFGGTVTLKNGKGAQALAEAMEAEPDALPKALADANGLLLVCLIVGTILLVLITALWASWRTVQLRPLDVLRYE